MDDIGVMTITIMGIILIWALTHKATEPMVRNPRHRATIASLFTASCGGFYVVGALVWGVAIEKSPHALGLAEHPYFTSFLILMFFILGTASLILAKMELDDASKDYWTEKNRHPS